MTEVPMRRRDFLGGRFRAVLGGPARAEWTHAPEVAPEATPAPEAAPFDRRRRALSALGPTKKLARIDRFACLASASQVCTTCLEHCPEPDALRLDGLLPHVDAERCTGCGECETVCPAPLGAIRVLPVLPSRAP